MDRVDLFLQLGELLDTVAGDAYEGWDDYWPDRNAEVDGLIHAVEDWGRRCRSMLEEAHNVRDARAFGGGVRWT